MSGLLFVSQAMLETWAEQGKIEFAGNVMTLLAGDGKGRKYALDPAVRFLKVVGGDGDPHSLVHKVKSVAQLREMGAEPVDDSCILGDTAYEVQPGFLAEGAALQAAASARPLTPVPLPGAAGAIAPVTPAASAPAAGSAGAPLPRDLEERRREAEALARYLLENLS
ncbi:MAG TPA: hypothetical protein VEB43_19425 [Anaeromyxobacter sp.]|nr:hypothetical protein [Anaeromyxobacter sp.]